MLTAITHRDICKSVAEWMLGQSGIQLTSWELGLDVGVIDAIGITTKTKKAGDPRIVIAEIKRTRSDLLQDLRKKKMLGYERRATHCYLAALPEAFLTPTQMKAYGGYNDHQFDDQIKADMADKGLPTHWGILVGSPYGEKINWRCVRSSRKTATRVTSATLMAITKKIALSFMYRILNPNSPIVEIT